VGLASHKIIECNLNLRKEYIHKSLVKGYLTDLGPLSLFLMKDFRITSQQTWNQQG